jgi:hypothetical protein
MAERRLPRGLLDPESQAIAEAYEAIPSVRRQTRGLLSLDPQEEQGMGQTAFEMLASFIPGVGQLLAGRDIERARRAGDPAAAAMAATEFLPFGRLAGMMRRPGPIMSEIDVYHGSPHRFEEFDASKIGTGEGAQAYGHGIYLAESPAVGRQYAEFLASRKNDLLDPGNLAASMMYRTSEGTKEAGLREIDAALKGIKNYPNSYPDAPQQKAALEKARELLESGAELPKQGGNFYTADLPDEMVDRMLDWDKPLSEQRKLATPILKELGYLRPNDNGPRQFAQAVKALNMEHGGFGEGGANGMVLFKAIHKGLEQGNPKAIDFAKRMNLGDQAMFMEASPLASEVMKRMGIPGIRYLDAGSRGQGGSSTRNFVVFPGEEKKVKILKRE